MAQLFDDGKSKTVGNAEKLRFLENFALSPVDRDALPRFLQERNLGMLTPDGRPLTQAICAAVQLLPHHESVANRIESLLEKAGNADNCQLLQEIANEFLVRIRVLSTFSPVTEVEVDPLSHPHKSVVDVLHLFGTSYSALTDDRRASRDCGATWVRSPPTARPLPTALSRHMQELLERLSTLKDAQREDDFLADKSGRGPKPKYEVVTRREALRLLQEEPAKYWRCRLSLQGAHEGFAEPCCLVADSGTTRIPLRGRRNCGMAFDGDVVAVCVFRSDAGVPLGGRVVCVLESTVAPVNRMFLCRVSREQATLMRPICGTVPKIHVRSDGAEEEYERTAMRPELEIYNFNRRMGSETARQQERARRQYASNCMVSVYSVRQSNNKGDLQFRLDRVERIQRLACERLFVVIYHKWSRRKFYPDGYVVDVIPPSASLEDEVALLRLQCQLPHPYKPGSPAVAEGKTILGTTDGNKEKKRRRDFRAETTFSIDNEDTQDVDDAVSVREVDAGLEVGVHITDVAHYVRHDSQLDRAARARAFSVYGVAGETAPVHMLPAALATDRLSLVSGGERLCLSVLLRFDADGRLQEEAEVVRSLVRSDRQLTKAEAARLLRTAPGEHEDAVERALRLLHRCTRRLRVERLGLAASVDEEEYEAVGEVGTATEADAMVEELMVAANVRVARLLLGRFPDLTPLRVQPPPDGGDVERWMGKHAAAARHSGVLCRELELAGVDLGRLGSERPLRLSAEVAAGIRGGDRDRAFRLLACERLHPALLSAVHDWHAISGASSYQRAGRRVDQAHFSLGESAYVHFTSPLRRYADLLAQRLVHAALEPPQSRAPVSPDAVDAILAAANDMEARGRRFKAQVALLSLHRRAARSPLSLPCTVTGLAGGRVALSHLVVSRLPRSARCLPFSRLGVDRLPEPLFAGRPGGSAEELGVSCTWRQRLFIVARGMRDAHANLRDLVNRGRARIDVRSMEPQFCLWKRHNVFRMPLPSLLVSFPGKQWDVMWKHLQLTPVENDSHKFHDVTSEMRFQEDGDKAITDKARIVLDPAVTFALDIEPGGALRVQFNAPAMRLARVRAPAMQYVQVCPSMGVCLEHRDDPISCFAAVTGDEVEEARRFRSVAQYRNAWLPLLRMETVHLAVTQGDTYHLAGVDIQWMTDGARLAGWFRLENDFCSNVYRQIRPQLGGELSDCLSDDHVFVEFLCIRVDVGPYVWICHAGVKYCSADETDVMRFFVVNQQSSPFPEEIVKEKRLATVEVIEKGLCSRYQERAVALLARVQDSIAVKMALGQFVRKETDAFQQSFLPFYEQKFCSGHLYTAGCNLRQREAIEKAFRWQVSFIWGPPGTGKTTTGVQITFWWAEFNRKFNRKEEEPREEEEEEKKDERLPSSQTTDPSIWKGFQLVDNSRKRRKRRKKTEKKVEEMKDDSDPLVRWIGFPDAPTDLTPEEVPLLLRREQVLYCGPSNDCVNCVAEHLRTKVEAGYLSLVRVFSSQVEKSDFPVPGHDAAGFQTHVRVPENLYDITLHRLVRQEGKPHASLLRRYDAAFRKVQRYLDGEQIGLNGSGRPLRLTWRNHRNLLGSLRHATGLYSRVLSAAKSLELRRHDVVLCTTTVAASYLVQLNCRFAQVVVDEAGMCTEAETLVPLSPFRGAGCASAAIKNVVLIGDHKQLRPILNSQDAADRGLERSMLQRHWTAGDAARNRTMLDTQYRMHPSICEFPSVRVYNSNLRTAVSPLWTGVEKPASDDRKTKPWSGLSADADEETLVQMRNANANVLRGVWPGQRSHGYQCMPGVEVSSEEERVVFLHVEGDEESLLLTTDVGNENSKSNLAEADEVVRVYMRLRGRFSGPRAAVASIAVLSQYQHQVHIIRERLEKALSLNPRTAPVAAEFQKRHGAQRKEAKPIVSSVVRSQGSEFDYVILSTVRSLRDHDIDPDPTPGWQKKYLGFITDTNQINVALTRARRGLIIIGNGKLLQVHHFWKELLKDLKKRGCYVADSRSFLGKAD